MLAVESSHKLSQTAISVCIVISASQSKPKNKNLLFFPSSPGESVNDEQSSFIHTSSLSGTDPGSHLHNHFPFILNCWWSSSSRKLGFISFIVPIDTHTHAHTRWRDSASISSTLSKFSKKQTHIFSFARRADATPLLCYDRCQKRLIFIHHVVKIADPWNKKVPSVSVKGWQ